jgi:hypothetical protein
MIANLIGELGVHVNYVVLERSGEQAVAHQNVVERLGVAFELVGIPLILRQRFDEGIQDTALQRGNWS